MGEITRVSELSGVGVSIQRCVEPIAGHDGDTPNECKYYLNGPPAISMNKFKEEKRRKRALYRYLLACSATTTSKGRRGSDTDTREDGQLAAGVMRLSSMSASSPEKPESTTFIGSPAFLFVI